MCNGYELDSEFYLTLDDVQCVGLSHWINDMVSHLFTD